MYEMNIAHQGILPSNGTGDHLFFLNIDSALHDNWYRVNVIADAPCPSAELQRLVASSTNNEMARSQR